MRFLYQSAFAVAYLCVATAAAFCNGKIKPKVMILTFVSLIDNGISDDPYARALVLTSSNSLMPRVKST